MYSFMHGRGGGWQRPWHQRRGQQKARTSRRAASGDALSNKGSYFERVKGLDGVLKASVTCGVTSAAGDLLAQFFISKTDQSQGRPSAPYDPLRTLRMAGFGLLWYGPYQYYWYNLLEHAMPVKNTANFLIKVALNQLTLAPVTLGVVFAWNLGLTGQLAALPDKLRSDLVPSMVNGWKFWIPAASLNFYAVPINLQVLYMSCCGMLWTAYLSYISSAGSSSQQQQQPALAAAGAGKGAKRR